MPPADYITINGITILIDDIAALPDWNAVTRLSKMLAKKRLAARISEATDRVHAAARNQELDPELLLNAAIYACTKTEPMTLSECLTAVEQQGAALIAEYLAAK
jgi:hypothetical protein